jgi:putative hydrolase of the HAD superfamily
MNSDLKMIFFDLDGTLINHNKAEILGVNGFFYKYKNYFDMNGTVFYEHWIRLSRKYFLKYLNGDFSFSQQQIERIKNLFLLSHVTLPDKEASLIFKDYKNIYESNLFPYDDVIPCLDKLKNKRLGIITNGDLSQQLYKTNKIGTYFEIVIAAGDIGISKPNIDIFKVACEKAGICPRDCMYVGDDLKTDILSCKQAGMKGIWLNRNNLKLEFQGIDMVTNLNELTNYL